MVENYIEMFSTKFIFYQYIWLKNAILASEWLGEKKHLYLGFVNKAFP